MTSDEEWGGDGTPCALAGLNLGETAIDDSKEGGQRFGHGDRQRSFNSKGYVIVGV